MRKTRFLSFAFCLAFAITDLDPVFAFPIAPQAFTTAGSPSATSTPDIDLARFGGRGGGGYRGFAGHRGAGVRGGYAYRGGARVAHRGYGFRGGGMYRGHGVHRAAVGRYRIGGRYYGGVWYGTGRRYWRGRWWPYGVGSCWRTSPIGYVWICG